MTTSIAMTTYNGEKYIETLLESIINQEVLPDEVVIVDDCSTDNTVEKMQQFLFNNKLENWRIYKNDHNIGWKANFREALRRCTGDLVFLCDQDDIWYADKIKTMKEIMKNHEEILLLISNYDVLNVDRKDKVKVRGLDKDDGTIMEWNFNEKALIVMRPGCTYCARKSLIDAMLRNDLKTEPHDLMLWGHAVICNGLYLFNKKTLKYRRHSDSASIASNVSREERKSDISYYTLFISILLKQGSKEKAQVLESQMHFIEERKEMINKKNRLNMLFFVAKSHNHYATFRSMIYDIFFAF